MWFSLKVLILVVVDDGLVQCGRTFMWGLPPPVLILVVVDDGLVHDTLTVEQFKAQVLILVVVDDGLVHYQRSSLTKWQHAS